MTCPACGQALRLAGRAALGRVRCARCQQRFTIEGPAGQRVGQPLPAAADLLALGFYQSQTRAEARKRSARLRAAEPAALEDAGDLEAAVEARVLRARGPAAGQCEPATRCAEADAAMDQALLLLRECQAGAAVELLAQAARRYRAAGPAAENDRADALWNLGFALGLAGRVHDGLVSLQAAGVLLRLQGRLRPWVQCGITALALRVVKGAWDLPQFPVLKLAATAARAGFHRELGHLALLIALRLQERGRAAAARRRFEATEALAGRADPDWRDGVQRLRRLLEPEAMLLRLVAGLTGRPQAGARAAAAALAGWDPAGRAEDELVRGLRAVVYARMLAGERAVPDGAVAAIYRELAVGCYARGDAGVGRKAGAEALRLDPGALDALRRAGAAEPDPARRAAAAGLLRDLDGEGRPC